jgi:peptidoglycan/xylan/chitin deacetylase (PgdA/CDA1 family)
VIDVRIAIFTSRADLRRSPWWEVIGRTPGLEGVLIVRREAPSARADVLHRFVRNVRKHGPMFVPFRVGLAVWQRVAPPRPHPLGRLDSARDAVPVEEILTGNVHAPETLAAVRAWEPDLGLSLGAPILKPSLFRIPRLGTMNVHSGRVPDYRGAPPAYWELATGAREIGATIHWIDEGLDTGDIVQQDAAPIYPHDRLADVEFRVEELAMRLLENALGAVVAGAAPRAPQPSGGHTYRMPLLMPRLRTLARLRVARLRRTLSVRNALKAAYFFAFIHVARRLRDIVRSLVGRHRVRIFTFHRVTWLCRDGMTVAPDVFERQMAYLKRTHDVVPLSVALERLRDGGPLRRPLAAVTFDDGYRTVLRHAKPVMDRFGFVGTCFVSTDVVGTDRRLDHDAANPVGAYQDVMSWSELAAMVADGWELGSHTATHARLSAIPAEEARAELERSREALIERFGAAEIALAYPFGQEDDIREPARTAARELGYAACLGDYGGDNAIGAEPFRLRRTELGGDHPTLAWKARVHGLDASRRGQRYRTPAQAPVERQHAVAPASANDRTPQAAAGLRS